MSKTIEIPGGFAVLRDPKDVRQRARRRLELASLRAQPAFNAINKARAAATRAAGKEVGLDDLALLQIGLTPEDFEAMYEVQTATILAYLADWSLENVPLPTSVEELDDLPAELYDALRNGTAQVGADAIAPVSFEPDPDGESPTDGGTGSAKSSKEQPESPSTPRLQISGESSAIDEPSAA